MRRRRSTIFTMTIPMGLEDEFTHIDDCPRACGTLYKCTACDRWVGRCHSHRDMPAVCILCRARFIRAWEADP